MPCISLHASCSSVSLQQAHSGFPSQRAKNKARGLFGLRTACGITHFTRSRKSLQQQRQSTAAGFQNACRPWRPTSVSYASRVARPETAHSRVHMVPACKQHVSLHYYSNDVITDRCIIEGASKVKKQSIDARTVGACRDGYHPAGGDYKCLHATQHVTSCF